MRKTTIIVAVMACLTAGAQQKWTLRDCIDHATKNNLNLQITRLQKRSATEDRKQSQADLLPSLSASTNQSVGVSPWQQGDGVSKTYYNGTYGLNAKWTVWNGGQNRNQLRSSKLAEEMAELSVEETSNSLQEQIAKLYVQVLYTTEAIGVNEQSLEASKKNEERGRQMLEVGSMSKAELAQLTAQRATDEYNLVEAKTNLQKYIIDLKQLLELNNDDHFEVATASAADAQALQQVPALSDAYGKALTARPEVQSAEKEVRQREIQTKIARAGYLPTVSLTGGVGTSTSSRNSDAWGSQLKTNFDASAGVGISIPIFDNRLNRTSVNKAKIQHEQALVQQQNTRDQLYNTMESYWLDAINNQEKFRAAQVSVDSEQQSYDLLSEQFQLGLKNIVELMNGKTSLLKAQQNKLQSKYMAILSIQLLKFYEGEELTL